MKEFSKYILAIARSSDSDDEAIAKIDDKIAELIAAERKEVLSILDLKEKDWGEVARSVKIVMAELRREIMRLD